MEGEIFGSRQVIHFCKYTVAGGLATLSDLGVFSFFTIYLGTNYLLSTVLAVLAGTVVKFLLCLKFVFRLQGRTTGRAWWYQLTASFGALAINLLLMFMLVDVLGVDRLRIFWIDGLLIARVITTGTVFLVNFAIAKYIVFGDYGRA